jgi:putative heme-binding domain-containing protein
MRKEIVQSLLHPSEIVAVPYLTKNVITTRGRIASGRISPLLEPGKVVVVQSDGQRIAVPQEQVDEARAIHVSDMPEGLLESLTSQEIQDLFAFLLADHVPQLARQPAAPAERDLDGRLAEPAASDQKP